MESNTVEKSPILALMLDPATFLEESWQKRPQLIRGAFPDFVSPLTPEELAGLAMEEGVASRIILEQGGEHPWELRLAPHDEGSFEALPETHWTLLVHEVDRLVPAVGRLLDRFRFLPNWRLDDVMISYAAPHGSVGAHLDHYDVFLLQGTGRRRWQIESTPRPLGEQSVPDLDVRLLQEFNPDQEWVLEPGDMLYLPPRFAHHGIAVDPCLTYSIGFRAPHQRELAAAYAADFTERARADARYGDPDLHLQDEPGVIDDATLERIRSLVERVGHDNDALADWFGRFATEPKREAPPNDDPEFEVTALRQALADPSQQLTRSAPCRFAHHHRSDGKSSLFVGGESLLLEGERRSFAALLSGTRALNGRSLAPYLDDASIASALCRWIDERHLILEKADD